MRHIIALLLLKFALSLSQLNKTYEAFNSSCIDQTYLIPNPSNTSILVTLPTFYQATLEVDLRHLQSNSVLDGVVLTLFINNTDLDRTYTESIPLSISSKTYSIFAANNLILSSYFTISGNSTNQIVGKSYLFSRSVSLNITQANPQGRQQNSFLFIVTNTDLISLPYNMITSSNANDFDGYFISEIRSASQLTSRQTTIPSYSDYWNGLQSVSLPYIPYLSNCQNQGNYMYFSQLIHNSSYCQLHGDQAVPINEFSFGSTAVADNCQFTTHCVYDEIPSISNQYPFWNTVGSVGSTLFSVTATEQSTEDLLYNFDSTQLVPCQLTSASYGNSSNKFPLKVSISFGYYQITSSTRRMITCQVDFSLYTDSSANFTYQLDISVYPLTHTQVLLNFGFRWYIYMLVFIIIGLVSNFQFIIFWCYHLIVTIKAKRNFNLRIYLRLVREILKGILPAAFISIFITFLVQIIMNGTFFGSPVFKDGFTSFWNYFIMNDIGYFASNIESSTRSGRMGFSYVVISLYLIVVLSDHLIGKQKKKQQYQTYEILGRKFKPQEWNRGKLMFVTLAYMLFSIYFLYFTYTTMFSENIWFIIAFLQIFQMVCQEVADAIFDDKLPCIPLKLTLGVLAYLATMGAIDLYYFILGYLVDVGISIIQITYLSQLQKSIKDYIEQKNQEINKFFAKIFNDQEDDQQKKSEGKETVFDNGQILINQELIQVNFLQKQVVESYNDLTCQQIPVYQQDEQIKRRFLQYMTQNNRVQKNENKSKGGTFVNNEQYERQKQQFQNIKFELIIDGSSAMMQYLVQPIIVFILWITYNTSTILSNFQISNQNTILYLLSSIILALFYQINIIIIFHVLELYLNTDYEKQFKQLLQRFQKRSTFWITDQQTINKKYEINLRGLYSYSISSQLFFIVGLYTISIYHFINGAITIISASFNIFKDPYIILISAFWIIFMQVFSWLLKQVAKLFDIWSYSSLSKKNKQETNIEEPFSSFSQETNEMLKKQEMFNSSSIKFTFKRINEPVQKIQEEHIEQIKKKNLQSKLATICKKLEPQFDKQDFRLNFARKNKDFIRQNIQKILPLVKSFPSDDTAWIGKGNVTDKRDLKKQNKNCDPMISDFLGNWMRRVETNRAKRQEEGIEHERKLKRCKFCFQTWGIYYGYDGICLQCSDNLFKNEEPKKTK